MSPCRPAPLGAGGYSATTTTAGGEHALSSSLGYLGLDIGRHCSSRHIAVLWLASADRTISSADANHMVSGPCADVCRFGQDRPPFRTPGFPFLRLECAASCMNRPLAATSPECRSAHANTSALIGLIWPKAGFASTA
jgi:hypothetical protein